MKVLVAEDDPHILSGLVQILEREGYTPIPARDGTEALELYRREAPDFVCLDIMMPGLNGYDVCREIRKADPEVPILFISAKSEEIDKVLGLELGADDFIVKPFGVQEALSRIRAITRRYLISRRRQETPAPFCLGDLTILPADLRARRGELTIELSLRDVSILGLLHRHRGQVVSRDMLYDACWGMEKIPNSRSVDQHISQLRKKIEPDPGSPTIIRTVHGAGYRYEE